MDEKMIKLQNKLRHKLSESRMEHSIGVMYTAANLAMAYGEDMRKATLAGLMHDCAKMMSDDELFEYCDKYTIEISEAEQQYPLLLHAKVGEHMAKAKYKVEEDDVLQAIRWHTTGKPEMTLLEKIIFVADYVEPNRKPIEGLEEIRNSLYQNLDRSLNDTVAQILKNTIHYLERKNSNKAKSMDANTLLAYEYYKKWSK